MIKDLSDREIKNVLTSQVLGRLACTDGKDPYIVPLTYIFDGKFLYGQTNVGKKLKILRKNPSVCFEVDMMTDMFNWKSVLVYGRFEELTGKQAEKARAFLYDHIFSYLSGHAIHPHEHEVIAGIDDSSRNKLIMYRIKIKKMTGRHEKK